MAYEVPITEPLVVTAGDLVTWKRSFSHYSAADGWVLSYALTTTSLRIAFSSTASGSDHLVSVPAATTAAWAAGDYLIQGYVTKAATSERYRVFEANIGILTNLAAASAGYDGRSHAKTVLDAIEAVLESRASKTVQSWSGLEQSFSLIPTAELLTMRDRYRAEYQAEQAASNIARGLGTRRNVFVRFTSPR